jgi:hypothetical protein
MSEAAEELISGVKGKLGELKGLGALLSYGYAVYTPVVDTGIDCLVDVGKGNYKEIQVKYSQERGLFQVKASRFQTRDSYYIMCNTPETYWVIPSKVFSKMAAHTTGYLRLQIGREGSESYEALRHYRENLNQLLTGAPKDTKQTVSTVRERIKEPHLKQQNYQWSIMERLNVVKAPLTGKQIIEWVYSDLKSDFSEADLAKLRSGGTRWEKTARWAITNLTRSGFIERKEKNQYVITPKGRGLIQKRFGTAGVR